MKKYVILIVGVVSCSFAQQTQRKLVWEENFIGKTLDEKVWNIEIGDGCPNCGWGNNERQLYTDSNHAIEKGNLVIKAKKEGNKYTSTRINTKSKKEFQYGRFEIRAKLPVANGLWPAFWMLGSNFKEAGWPKCGEIDILEYVGREPHVIFNSLHTQDSHGNTINTKKTTIPDIEKGFHLYAIDWDKDKIAFYVDNQLTYTFQPKEKNENTWPYNQPFYFLANLAIGGNFGGQIVDDAALPDYFYIDYIKVYQ